MFSGIKIIRPWTRLDQSGPTKNMSEFHRLSENFEITDQFGTVIFYSEINVTNFILSCRETF